MAAKSSKPVAELQTTCSFVLVDLCRRTCGTALAIRKLHLLACADSRAQHSAHYPSPQPSPHWERGPPCLDGHGRDPLSLWERAGVRGKSYGYVSPFAFALLGLGEPDLKQPIAVDFAQRLGLHLGRQLDGLGVTVRALCLKR